MTRNANCLSRLPSLFQNAIQKVVIDLALLGLQRAPAPSSVMDGGRNPRRQVLVVVRRPVECLPAHAGIGQDLVRLLGHNSDPVSIICQSEGQPTELTDRGHQQCDLAGLAHVSPHFFMAVSGVTTRLICHAFQASTSVR